MMTKIINLFGGPGSGKSTIAAGLFSYMKKKGFNCELVTEFAKDLTWAGRDKDLKDQLYVFANQNHRLEVLLGKVDIVITDSPILQGIVYTDPKDTELIKFIEHKYNQYNNLNLFVKRINPSTYAKLGRSQTLEESIEIDRLTLKLLEDKTYETINKRSDFTSLTWLAVLG